MPLPRVPLDVGQLLVIEEDLESLGHADEFI
jgi:hypothetical protein